MNFWPIYCLTRINFAMYEMFTSNGYAFPEIVYLASNVYLFVALADFENL